MILQLQERQHQDGMGPTGSPSASSPDSADSQYVAKQHHRIQQARACTTKIALEGQKNEHHTICKLRWK